MHLRNHHYSKVTKGLALAWLTLFSTTTRAQDNEGRKSQSLALDNISLSVGGYYTNNDSTIGAKTGSVNRSTAKLEDDLDFRKRKIVPRVRLDFLIGDHQGFTFDYYRVDRSQASLLAERSNFVGQRISAEARVDSSVKFTFGSAAYKWWFGTGNDVFGAGIGAAYYRIGSSIRGTADANGEVLTGSSSGDANAWAPNLQLGWRHAFNDQWRMYFNASGVKKNGGRLSGHIYDVVLGVEWFPWQNVGFGAEYAYTKIQLQQAKRHFDVDLDMKLNGPAAYVRLRF